jgi:DDE superfamily endonuclease
MARWDANQVIFLDESGVNSGSGTRTHGWGPKGHIIPYPILFQNRANFSILPAMTIDGYIACDVYSGAVNADTFNSFVENQLIPALHEIDAMRAWIIVLDNASIHRSDVPELHNGD